jgi:hypothetical protein
MSSHPRRCAISKVFINFRVGDGQDTAMLIEKQLRRSIGTDNVFRSSWNIGAGEAFKPALIKAASECEVMIVVIGPNWLTIKDGSGRPKIESPEDWVRVEIELALDGGAKVIPILVGDTPNPNPDELPPTVRPITGHQNIRLHHRSGEYNLMQITDAVRALVGEHADGSVAPPPPRESTLLTSLPAPQRSIDVRVGTAELNGRHYGNSVVYRCDMFCNDPRGWMDFNLRKQFRLLEVTAGVLDDASEPHQTGMFQVVLDEVIREQFSARQGQSRTLRVDVTGVLRLRLLAYRDGTTVNPALAGARMAGGLSNHLPALAWGTPTLYA